MKKEEIKNIDFPTFPVQPPITQRLKIKQDEVTPDQIVKIKVTPTLPTQTTVGIIESDGINLYWCDSAGVRHQLN